MKYLNSSRKTIALAGIFLAIVLCGIFYFDKADSAANAKNAGIVTADSTPFEKQRHIKEIELKEALCNFDKENIVEAWVYLGNADNEITFANIFIVGHEEITNEGELIALASESLGLDIENIYLQHMDVETFTSSER